MKHLLPIVLLILGFVVGGVNAQGDGLTVVATTTILADVAANVAGDLLTVEPLLPPDTDTHAYEPTVDDVARVAQADALLVVGAGYEEFLAGLLENAGEGVTVIEASTGLEILAYAEEHGHEEGETHAEGEADEHGAAEVLGVLGTDGFECEAGHEHEADATPEAAEAEAHEHEHGSCDPHVWMNPRSVIGWTNNIAAAFAELDPANADAYRANADAYIAQLEALDAEIQQIVAAVPEDRRILVTNHEFMAYFAAAYGFEVAATVLPGGSTAAEIDPQSLAELIALVGEEEVPAIFAEVSASPAIAEVLAQEAGINVVTALYSESLSGADGPAATYIDFMRHNAQTIADALGG